MEIHHLNINDEHNTPNFINLAIISRQGAYHKTQSGGNQINSNKNNRDCSYISINAGIPIKCYKGNDTKVYIKLEIGFPHINSLNLGDSFKFSQYYSRVIPLKTLTPG